MATKIFDRNKLINSINSSLNVLVHNITASFIRDTVIYINHLLFTYLSVDTYASQSRHAMSFIANITGSIIRCGSENLNLCKNSE